MTRRKIMALVGVLGLVPAAVAKPKSQMPELLDMIRTFDPSFGDVGHGTFTKPEVLIAMLPAIKGAGFSPYALPAKSDDQLFMALYNAAGAPCLKIWCGFTRPSLEIGRCDVVSFELCSVDMHSYVINDSERRSFYKIFEEAWSNA